MTLYMYVSVSTRDIGQNAYNDGSFLAEVFNEIGYQLEDEPEEKFRARFLQDFAANLDDKGEAALRQLVARLDAIDATSTEGR